MINVSEIHTVLERIQRVFPSAKLRIRQVNTFHRGLQAIEYELEVSTKYDVLRLVRMVVYDSVPCEVIGRELLLRMTTHLYNIER